MRVAVTRAFFTTSDGAWFTPTPHCRGPWDAQACHAGPPTGLIARALEAQAPEPRLVRLTLELMRPIPFAEFTIDTEVVRSGRTVTTSRAVLRDRDGMACATAGGLHIARAAERPLPSAVVPHPGGQLSDARPGPFPFTGTLHGLDAFNGDGVELAYPPGETTDAGPTTLWMRTVPLLEDETPSSFQRICPLADCGNAVGRNAEPGEFRFINPDLSLTLHREPEGEWLGMRAECHWQPDGIGMSDALLFDERGPVGRAVQTLIIR